MRVEIVNKIISLIKRHWEVDAIYLYGSRAKGTALESSDWDIAVLFTDYISDDVLERHLRPQEVQALLERELKLYDKISVVDLEIVPPPLQFNIIRCQRIYDRGVSHVRRVEYSIYSKIEKDYEYGT